MKNKNSLLVMILIVVLFNSIVYSALNSEMFIGGDAHIRVDKDIRITDVKVLEQSNNAYETYNSDYSKNTTSMQVTLPSSDSVMIYEVTITNKGDIDYEVTNIVEESYSNNNIKYELIEIEKGEVIDGGTTHTFKIKFTTTENNPDNKTTLVLKYTFEEWIPSLYNMVAHKSRDLDTDIDFGVAPTIETSGVYEMNNTKDDKYPVYYYRGIVDDNNVSFAGFCWKIVRTTSTGGVKLIYNGVPASDGSCNDTGEASQITNNYFNSSYQQSTNPQENSLYLGYMYNGVDSSIKDSIDKWYEENMILYTNMLEDTIWCNDKSTPTINGTTTHYGSYERLTGSKKTPIIACPNKSDSFTIDEKNGNGLLKYPIALLTADELSLAGSIFITSSNNYLFTNTNWWTMSPANQYLNSASKYASGIFFSQKNIISSTQADNNIGIRPSISLVSSTLIKGGDGSISNPYKLVEDKITKEWSFDYTGGEQEFKVPYYGVYKLEVWGGQGGSYNSSYIGGYGGYSSGNIDFIKGTNLYINVAGAGARYDSTTDKASGGYNGGGSGYRKGYIEHTPESGGGSSHIALASGLLSALGDNKDNVLIVAGGGGGAFYHSNKAGARGSGGAGGGYIGNSGSGSYSGSGGTQSQAGSNSHDDWIFTAAVFGAGCNTYHGAGGAGWYGGGSGYSGAGGGSGYIGNPLLNNKEMYCYKCEESNEESTKTISTTNVSEEAISYYAKKGNGYAKITLIEKK